MKRLVSAAVVGLTLVAIAAPALGHERPGEPAARNEKHCANLSDANLRAECTACVAKDKHHYHPGAPAGSRCHAN